MTRPIESRMKTRMSDRHPAATAAVVTAQQAVVAALLRQYNGSKVAAARALGYEPSQVYYWSTGERLPDLKSMYVIAMHCEEAQTIVADLFHIPHQL